MIKLFFRPLTRAARTRWLLEELNVSYEVELVASGADQDEDYLKIHPLGVVPAISDGDVTIFESLGTCLYLADKYKAAPESGTKESALYFQWMAYSIATIEPAIFKIFGAGDEDAKTAAKENMSTIVSVVSNGLGEQEYLVGDTFTAADVMIGSVLAWIGFRKMIAFPPNVQAYIGRLTTRPAFKIAYAE